jgi:hypothetical protein
MKVIEVYPGRWLDVRLGGETDSRAPSLTTSGTSSTEGKGTEPERATQRNACLGNEFGGEFGIARLICHLFQLSGCASLICLANFDASSSPRCTHPSYYSVLKNKTQDHQRFTI